MLQPFEIFKINYLERLLKLKKFYLVTQTYKNGFNPLAEIPATAILVSDYDDIGLAKIHLAAVINDKYASVIDLTKEKHRMKLQEMMAPDSAYTMYWAVVNSAEALKKKVDIKYKNNIRRWIEKNTTWRVGADETVRPQLSVIFGELFIIIKRGSQQVRVKFEEIEKS